MLRVMVVAPMPRELKLQYPFLEPIHDCTVEVVPGKSPTASLANGPCRLGRPGPQAPFPNKLAVPLPLAQSSDRR